MDCQLGILNHLDISSLLSISETNKHSSALVSSVLRRRLSKKQVLIVITNYADKDDDRIQETDEYIRIRNIETSSKILKRFGDVISNLKIENNLLHNELTKRIYKLANLYCSKTLIQLRLTNPQKVFVDEFTKPFKKVESISLRGDYMQINIGDLNFREIFPSMFKLSFGMINPMDSNWRFSSISRTDPWSLTGTIFEKIIVNNTQIRRVVLRNVSPKMLRLMAEKLPLLESLVMKYFAGINTESENQKIYFKNVKYLKTTFGCRRMFENTVFEKLSEFETDAFPICVPGWIEFVEKNKGLRTLHVTRELSNEEILKLAAINSSLNKITTSFAMNVESESIAHLVENSKQLQNMDFTLSGKFLWDEILSLLEERFANEWTWTGNIDSFRIFIKRR